VGACGEEGEGQKSVSVGKRDIRNQRSKQALEVFRAWAGSRGGKMRRGGPPLA